MSDQCAYALIGVIATLASGLVYFLRRLVNILEAKFPALGTQVDHLTKRVDVQTDRLTTRLDSIHESQPGICYLRDASPLPPPLPNYRPPH